MTINVISRYSKTGFTIVELLIVIVVIAVLATITVVAYNGIQSRAKDSKVINDINSFVKKVRLHEADKGALPVAGSKSALDSTQFPGFTFTPSKDSYDKNVDNLVYCDGTKTGLSTFAISARSSSGKMFVYRPSEGIVTVLGGDPYSYCMAGFDVGTVGYSYAYYSPSKSWYNWANN